MALISRRAFCTSATSSVVAMAIPATTLGVGAKLQNNHIQLGLIGCGNRMGSHLKGFSQRDDCKIVAVCDVDKQRVNKAATDVQALSGKAPAKYSEMRKLLENPQIDAVVISTPDHWHCLAAIWACQAGKDVYVEKPVSHSVWEGRQLVKAARKYERIVQVGMQNRSASYNLQAREYLASGKLGEIHLVRVYNQENDPPKPAQPDSNIPAHFHWTSWLGPAPERAYNPRRHHAWRQFWDYSGGDVTDDSVHQLDLACMLLGIDRLPKTVHSVGFRHPNGNAEVAGTLATQFEYDDLLLLYNQTQNTPYMLKSDNGVRSGEIFPHWPQSGTRIEIFGSKGLMIVGRHGGGWQVFHRTKSRQPVVAAEKHGKFPDREHQANFIEAIRSRDLPNGDVLQGHNSAALCHLANISFRLGNQHLHLDVEQEALVGNDAGNGMLRPQRRAEFAIPEEI